MRRAGVIHLLLAGYCLGLCLSLVWRPGPLVLALACAAGAGGAMAVAAHGRRRSGAAAETSTASAWRAAVAAACRGALRGLRCGCGLAAAGALRSQPAGRLHRPQGHHPGHARRPAAARTRQAHAGPARRLRERRAHARAGASHAERRRQRDAGLATRAACSPRALRSASPVYASRRRLRRSRGSSTTGATCCAAGST